MRLENLVNLQKTGALKVLDKNIDGTYLVGERAITEQECKDMVANLGWVTYDLSPVEIIEKTNKFIGGLKSHIKDPTILGNTEVRFENHRKANTMSYFERIEMECQGRFKITILCGMTGIKGKYGVYSSTNNFRLPVMTCGSLKKLGEWIAKL